MNTNAIHDTGNVRLTNQASVTDMRTRISALGKVISTETAELLLKICGKDVDHAVSLFSNIINRDTSLKTIERHIYFEDNFLRLVDFCASQLHSTMDGNLEDHSNAQFLSFAGVVRRVIKELIQLNSKTFCPYSVPETSFIVTILQNISDGVGQDSTLSEDLLGCVLVASEICLIDARLNIANFSKQLRLRIHDCLVHIASLNETNVRAEPNGHFPEAYNCYQYCVFLHYVDIECQVCWRVVSKVHTTLMHLLVPPTNQLAPDTAVNIANAWRVKQTFCRGLERLEHLVNSLNEPNAVKLIVPNTKRPLLECRFDFNMDFHGLCCMSLAENHPRVMQSDPGVQTLRYDHSRYGFCTSEMSQAFKKDPEAVVYRLARICRLYPEILAMEFFKQHVRISGHYQKNVVFERLETICMELQADRDYPIHGNIAAVQTDTGKEDRAQNTNVDAGTNTE